MSSGAGSFEHTSRFIGPLLAFLFPDTSPETLVVYHAYIRKFGHLAAYAILAFLSFRAVRRVRSWPFVSLGIVVAVAVIDEIIQSYNAARSGTITDVLIDCAGGLCAVAALWAMERRRLVTDGSPE